MITNEWLAGKDGIETPIEVREAVFGKDGSEDAYDEYAMHLCVFVDGECVAAGRIFVGKGNRFYISHICVKEAYRGQGIGDLTAKLLLYKTFQSASEVRAEIAPELESFFARYGFEAESTDGEVRTVSLKKEDCVYPTKCAKGANSI